MAHFNSPFLLGFDQLEQMMESVARSGGDSYPPYNIEQLSEECLRISLAVAGFREEDLSVVLENNQLLIKGSAGPKGEERSYIHRGIATRQFMRRFVLAEGMEVSDAFLEHGLLNIDLKRPEHKEVVKSIPIRRA